MKTMTKNEANESSELCFFFFPFNGILKMGKQKANAFDTQQPTNRPIDKRFKWNGIKIDDTHMHVKTFTGIGTHQIHKTTNRFKLNVISN